MLLASKQIHEIRPAGRPAARRASRRGTRSSCSARTAAPAEGVMASAQPGRGAGTAGGIACELRQDTPERDRPQDEQLAWFSRLEDCERIILEHIERID